MKNTSDHHLNLCEETTSVRIPQAVVYSLMFLSGTVTNLFVIYLVVSFKKLRTTSNAFIVNGCVADLLVCAFWMPHELILVSTNSSLIMGYHVFKDSLLFLGITVSLLSHSLIAVNRYVLITKVPATYLSVYQRRNTEWMIAISWLLSLVFVLPWLTAQRHPADGCSLHRFAVLTAFSKHRSVLANSYTSGFSAVIIMIQTAVILYCYFKIFRKVQISVKRVSVLNFQIVNNLPYSFPRKDKRLGVYVLSVCCIFLLTTEPMFWVLFLGLFRSVPKGVQTVSWLVFSSLFVLNPFIYTWKNEEFRKSFRSVMMGEFWRGSTVGVEPVIQTISQQTSRRVFSTEIH
ncbi:probable G-protein coupled receptor 88 [Acipenser ruthenus]|uniref:probable G-protein coupled receptor 88 n=1 Tax=Acipenser ruthenus TaxID=7906 RepID=UPI00145A03B6|nr:probable G-protein coupled receptor 88 [Acipenser ruthenus]